MLAAHGGEIVIVGAGQAAVQAIDTLRRKGFTGPITLVGDEPQLPYQRPPLSKKYLSGALERERLLIRPAHFYADHASRPGSAAAPRGSTARRAPWTLDDGRALAYDALLLATGSCPARLTCPGADLDRRAFPAQHRGRGRRSGATSRPGGGW